MSCAINNNNFSDSQESSVVDVSIPLFNGLAAMNRKYAEEVIRMMANHYSFDAEEAIRLFVSDRPMQKAERVPRGTKKEKPVKSKEKVVKGPEVVLPWTGKVIEGCCEGIRLNHGLHTQCTMTPLESGRFCKTCQKQADSNANSLPTYGSITERTACGINEYRDPKGKQSTPYSKVMSKLGITREQAETAASALGITIPEECFETRALRKGRPRKDGSTSSDTESSQQSQTKRGRGRPKKKEKVVESNNGDDLIASLVASAANSAANSAAAAPSPVTAPLDLKILVNDSVISPEPSPVAAPVAPAPSPVSQQEPVALKPKKTKKTGPSDEELAKQGIVRQYIDGVEYYNQNNDIYLPNGDHVGFWNGTELELAEDDSETEESE
tara:strand:- start:60 stop:1208 length:1149 start_codon:yes stop_codon:yes gene_type:complete